MSLTVLPINPANEARKIAVSACLYNVWRPGHPLASTVLADSEAEALDRVAQRHGWKDHAHYSEEHGYLPSDTVVVLVRRHHSAQVTPA